MVKTAELSSEAPDTPRSLQLIFDAQKWADAIGSLIFLMERGLEQTRIHFSDPRRSPRPPAHARDIGIIEAALADLRKRHNFWQERLGTLGKESS
jgi:hypothetical protein